MTAAVEGALHAWYQKHPPFTVGGSLYAVPPAHRAATALALADRQCRVHVDVIIDPRGRSIGVGREELAAARVAAPGARLDLHLILDPALTDDTAADLLGAITQDAVRLGAEAVTMNPARATRHPMVVDRLRRAGISLWFEHGASRPIDVTAGGADGALVMFIPPGTKQAADPLMLTEVARLSPTLPTAVDGGITADLASRCAAEGATYIVAGRSLLTAAALSAPSQPIRKEQP
ncbi:hypothetical protein ABZ922_25420 [Streptomyces shenzhenensis]|uniref:hypothetical protein n=1 Tax=Streptomyces shenzhenensis TaxID=943815 RepID=UPI00340E04E6